MIKLTQDERVIETLERLLEEAKSGDIQSIAYACFHPAYKTSSGWSGMGKSNVHILGELTILQRDIQDMLKLSCIDPRTGEENY